MLNPNFEKEKKISSEELYAIVVASYGVLSSSTEEGPIDTYLYERHLAVLAMQQVYEEISTFFEAENAENKTFLSIWDEICKQGYFDKFVEEYELEWNYLYNIGMEFLNSYRQYNYSVMALTTILQDVSAELVTKLVELIQKNPDLGKLFQITEKLGLLPED